MAACMRLKLLLITLEYWLLNNFAYSLYEDQVGKFDWRQQYIGKVQHAEFDQGVRRVIVTTEQNVIASLNIRTGQILWRQVYENGSAGHIDAAFLHNVFITISGGGRIIRSWETIYGYTNWEVTTGAAPGEWTSATLGGGKIIVVSDKLLSVHSLLDGSQVWSRESPTVKTVNYSYVAYNDDLIYIIGVVVGSHITVIIFDMESGQQVYITTISSVWLDKKATCQVVGVKHLSFICTDYNSNSLQVLTLSYSAPAKAFVIYPLNTLGVQTAKIQGFRLSPLTSSSSNYIWVHISPTHQCLFQVDVSQRLLLIKNFPGVTHLSLASIEDHPYILTLGQHNAEHLIVQGFSIETTIGSPEFNEILFLPQHHGNVERIFPLIFPKKDRSLGYRILLLTQDYCLSLAQQSVTYDKLVWSREESLSSILSVEMVDLPVSENQAKFEDEFGSSQENIFTMVLKRLWTQFQQIKSFILRLIQMLIGDSQQSQQDQELDLTRDEFNLHKLIITATASGKIIALDNMSGKIVWQKLIKNMIPFNRYGREVLLLYVQRTTAHFPHPPQCIVIGKHKVTGNGILFVFNPITGQSLAPDDRESIHLDYPIIQTSLFYQPDAQFLKGVLLLDPNLKVHVYPSSLMEFVVDLLPSHFIYTVDITTGILKGYSIVESENKTLLADNVWTVLLSRETQLITNVVAKHVNEHVHSQGRVLGDRSVLYKYLNPNLIVVSTEGEDNTPKPFLNIYLIDTVSGNILFSANHKRSKGQVHIVHSENWVVYSYFNEKSRRTELTVLELFEGTTQSNTTAFSSLHPPPPPLVERQAYIFSASVSAMTETITEKGITNKHVLIAMPSGSILEVERAILDPRRPNMPTAEHREEGLLPYIPEIAIHGERIINYNQTVLNVRGIHAAPSGLESTVLILAYGLDLFYTRVCPSRQFDVLKDDFDHMFILAVLSGLIIASYISKRFAARKALKAAWK